MKNKRKKDLPAGPENKAPEKRKTTVVEFNEDSEEYSFRAASEESHWMEDNPEVMMLRSEYLQQVRNACEIVFGVLDEREQNIALLYFADGISVQEIAKSQNLHRTSVHRIVRTIHLKALELRNRIYESLDT